MKLKFAISATKIALSVIASVLIGYLIKGQRWSEAYLDARYGK